jgi:hypothetical protein
MEDVSVVSFESRDVPGPKGPIGWVPNCSESFTQFHPNTEFRSRSINHVINIAQGFDVRRKQHLFIFTPNNKNSPRNCYRIIRTLVRLRSPPKFFTKSKRFGRLCLCLLSDSPFLIGAIVVSNCFNQSRQFRFEIQRLILKNCAFCLRECRN